MPALHSFKSNIDFATLVITSNMFEYLGKVIIVLPLECCKMLYVSPAISYFFITNMVNLK